MNADWDADGLFLSDLPLAHSENDLSSSLSTAYDVGKP